MKVDFLTPDDLAPLVAMTQQVLQAQQAAAVPADDYLSVEQVASLTGHSAKTVRKWIAEGKHNEQGQLIKLYKLEFAPGFPRVPRSALLAFGRGLGFDERQLQLPPAGARRPVLDSAAAMRKAS